MDAVFLFNASAAVAEWLAPPRPNGRITEYQVREPLCDKLHCVIQKGRCKQT